MIIGESCNGCDCNVDPDCFGCSPPNEPVSWTLDFAPMSYTIPLSDSDSFSAITGTCDPMTGDYDKEVFSIDRTYPDISSWGQSNVLIRETSPICSWGFGMADGYVEAREDFLANGPQAGDCRCPIPGSTVSGSVTLDGTYRQAFVFPGSSLQAQLDALLPATCGTVVGQCSVPFPTTPSDYWMTCHTSLRLGFGSLLTFSNGNLKLSMTWGPIIQYSVDIHNGSGFPSLRLWAWGAVGFGGDFNFDEENVWQKSWKNVFPSSTLNYGDLLNRPAWEYSAPFDCNTELDPQFPLPKTLDLVNPGTVPAAWEKWGLIGMPSDVLVTPVF